MTWLASIFMTVLGCAGAMPALAQQPPNVRMLMLSANYCPGCLELRRDILDTPWFKEYQRRNGIELKIIETDTPGGSGYMDAKTFQATDKLRSELRDPAALQPNEIIPEIPFIFVQGAKTPGTLRFPGENRQALAQALQNASPAKLDPPADFSPQGIARIRQAMGDPTKTSTTPNVVSPGLISPKPVSTPEDPCSPHPRVGVTPAPPRSPDFGTGSGRGCFTKVVQFQTEVEAGQAGSVRPLSCVKFRKGDEQGFANLDPPFIAMKARSFQKQTGICVISPQGVHFLPFPNVKEYSWGQDRVGITMNSPDGQGPLYCAYKDFHADVDMRAGGKTQTIYGRIPADGSESRYFRCSRVPQQDFRYTPMGPPESRGDGDKLCVQTFLRGSISHRLAALTEALATPTREQASDWAYRLHDLETACKDELPSLSKQIRVLHTSLLRPSSTLRCRAGSCGAEPPPVSEAKRGSGTAE